MEKEKFKLWYNLTNEVVIIFPYNKKHKSFFKEMGVKTIDDAFAKDWLRIFVSEIEIAVETNKFTKKVFNVVKYLAEKHNFSDREVCHVEANKTFYIFENINLAKFKDAFIMRL